VLFFCGAGISADSSLPLAREFLGAVLRELPLERDDRELVQDSKLPFEAVLQTLRECTGSLRRLIDIFARGRPNSCHHVLARLMVECGVPAIITTNFDILLERAMRQCRLRARSDFRAVSRERDMRRLVLRDIPSLIHIHGSVTDRASVAATLDAVSAHSLLMGRRNVLAQAFGAGRRRTVVVLGYSWSDLFDISPIVASIAHQDRCRIVLIDHRHHGPARVQPARSLKPNHPLHSYSGYVVRTNTRGFLEALSDELSSSGFGRDAKSDDSWRIAVRSWGKRVPLGRRYLAAANLLRHTQYVERSRQYLEETLAWAVRTKDTRLHVQALGSKGHLSRAMAEYEQAIQCFSAIVLRSRRNQGLHSQALKDLATVHRELGNLDEATRHCAKAITAARAAKDRSQLAHALACRAGLLSVAHDFVRAAPAHSAAARAFARLGEVRAEAAALTNAAEALTKLGSFDAALERLQAAGQLAGDCGDSRVAVAIVYELGRLARTVQASGAARELFVYAKRLAEARRQRAYVVVSISNLSGLATESGRNRSARRLLREAMTVAGESKNLVSLARMIAKPLPLPDSAKALSARRDIDALMKLGLTWLLP